jgi:hypothetical protein
MKHLVQTKVILKLANLAKVNTTGWESTNIWEIPSLQKIAQTAPDCLAKVWFRSSEVNG